MALVEAASVHERRLRPQPMPNEREPPNSSNVGGVVVRLLDKAKAMDLARDLVVSGRLKLGDMGVLWGVLSRMDNKTGETVMRYRSIAEGLGMSRSSVVQAIKRLKSAGVIEIRQRHYKKTHGKTATAFRLGPASTRDTVGQDNDRGSSSILPIMVSHLSPIPNGKDQLASKSRHRADGVFSTIAGAADEIDWEETALWLWEKGGYRDIPDGLATARQDLGNWRSKKGDKALAVAVKNARARGLYGDPLLDFLHRTYPGKGIRKSRVGPS